MKRQRIVKQTITYIGAILVCSMQMMGCYPIVPAYFAAAFLEEVSGAWLTATMYLGMLYFMPLTATVKYAMAVLVAAGAIKLVQWANEGCPAPLAGILAAVSTMILSFCGGLLEWKDQPQMTAVFLEGVFVFGATILINRLLHAFLEWEIKERQTQPYLPEQENGERLAEYAESFQGLSNVFFQMSRKKEQYTQEEFGKIQNELTGRLCAGCDSCAVCWEREDAPLYGVLSRMIASIWNVGAPEKENEEELAQYCRRSKDMADEAVRVFEKVNLNRAWYNRLLENRQTIAEQLDAMAYIMKDCARGEKVLDAREKRALAEIRYRARGCGVIAEELHLFEQPDGRLKLSARLRTKMGGCVSVKTFVAAVSRVLGRDVRAAADCKTFISKEAVNFLFHEDTKYRSVQGIARLKKDGAQISGDNFSFLEMERGELLLGLSDGMGSGSTACRESEMVLDLVERFLEAGFSAETAIRMMNAAMVTKGESDLYSTVDLCTVNLYDGDADFYKIGAAGSFLKRGDEVSCFAAGSLPVGVGTNPEIARKKMTLKNGDFIVMMTDGVLEYLHVAKPEETMQEIIGSIKTNHPGILAKKIMERVLLFTGGKAADDMTILAACIWEK